jgi:hypothetical protein
MKCFSLLVPPAACLTCLLLVFTAPLAAQDSLPPTTISNNGLWSADERQTVTQFVDQQITKLLGGEEEQLTSAREALLGPFDTAGATDLFKRQFTQEIARKLGPVMEAQDTQARTNAMIVAQRFTHVDGLGHITAGLNDDSAAVRYAAAGAAAHLLDNADFDGNQRQGLLDRIEDSIDGEDDPFVVQPLLDGLLKAGGPKRVVEALNRRLDWHIARPEATYDPERGALYGVYERLAVQPSPDRETVRQLGRAASRYFLLASQQLNQNVVPEDTQRSHVEMIRMSYTALEFSHLSLNAASRVPVNPEQFLNFRNWGQALKIAQDWQETLKQAPYSFTDQDLEVVEPQQQEAANAG